MAIDEMDVPDSLPLPEQVGLAVRAWRRREGLSQRELATELGWSQSMISRLENRAGSVPLDTVHEAVTRAGFQVVVAHEGRPVAPWQWERTDLVARDRGGRRFPAQRRVYPAPRGPFWWWEQEFIRLSRPLGPQPRWTTVGLDIFGWREDRPGDRGAGPTLGP